MSGRLRGNKKTGETPNPQSLKDAYFSYLELSKLLFAAKEPIYDINELEAECKFYAPAQKIAKQLKIDWKQMTHEESNRIMLGLLEDYYNNMAKVVNTRDIVITVNFKLNQNEQGKKE